MIMMKFSPAWNRFWIMMMSFSLMSLVFPRAVSSFSSSGMPIPMNGGSNNNAGGTYNLDRFQSICPANQDAIKQFDPSLISVPSDDESSSSIWVAVFRSNNNKPSVMVRDEFFHAMKIATTTDYTDQQNIDAAAQSTSSTSSFLKDTRSLLEIGQPTTPVAVAQLRPSLDFDGCYILDSLRCSLKKENTDASCDCGSEYTEALSVAVDSLVLHHLQRRQQQQQQQQQQQDYKGKNIVFEGTIRTKATIHSGRILEERGFAPVEELSKDMATHISKYESCLQHYAKRSIQTPGPDGKGKGFVNPKANTGTNASGGNSVSAGTRDRALQIVSLLGQLDPEVQRQADQSNTGMGHDDNDGEYDPWANINIRR